MKKIPFFDIAKDIEMRIHKKGGWVNTHAHLDRAHSLTKKSFVFANRTLQEKWKYVDELKRTSSVSDYYDRMAYALEMQIKQSVKVIGTFIDIDSVAKDKVIQASDKIKKTFKNAITIRFINQTLKGVLDIEARYWFDLGASYVDIIGGLPGKDKGREQDHLDIILGTAKLLGKRVHVHVDQLNDPQEKETELLLKKMKEHHMEGQVAAIHCISLGAQKIAYREHIYAEMLKMRLAVVACPTAWIDSRRSEVMSPTHNAVTPADEMVPKGIPVALGTDNIGDVYKPFSDGVMWNELRFLLESTHFYDCEKLSDIATIHGKKALGI